MEWISLKIEKPEKTGPYIVSLSRPYGAGQLVFNYVAYYVAEENQWFKYDPFVDKFKPEVKIEDNLIGWMKDVGSYFGIVG